MQRKKRLSISNDPGYRQPRRTVFIKDPRALPGASFYSLIAVAMHYLILAFLLLSGRYYNSNPPPTFLFIVPLFAASGSTVLGLLCLVMQNNRLVRKLCQPASGIPLAIAGTLGGAAYCLVVYGSLERNFTQAIQLAETAAAMLIYFVLIRRRLRFAGIAFSQGAGSISQLKSMWFRTLIHSLVLLAYTGGWCIFYIQLIALAPDTPATVSAIGNSTGNLTGPVHIPLPQWIININAALPVSSQGITTAGRAFLIYNLIVVSQSIKASLWMSVSCVVSDASKAVQTNSVLKLQPSSELNYKIWTNLPSILFLGHAWLISQFMHSIAEAFRRFNSRRSGLAYNVGTFLLFILQSFLSGCNSYGICIMQKTSKNIIRSSKEARHVFSKCGLDVVVNDDLLCGSRLCSCLLLASAGSIVGSTLMAIFDFPITVALEIQLLNFMVVFLIGNWGMDCAEAWTCSLFLEFAAAPEVVYIMNPPLAVEMHNILFGVPRQSTKESIRRVHASIRKGILLDSFTTWSDAVSSQSQLGDRELSSSIQELQSYNEQEIIPEESAGTNATMEDLDNLDQPEPNNR